MKTLAEIFYDAIAADDTLMTAIGGRVVSTCFEVAPGDDDNTPLPNIVITNDGFQNNTGTKDTVWEDDEETVQATVDIAAASPDAVDSIVAKVRQAIEAHIVSLYQQGHPTPQLQQGFPSSDGIAWDWMKPCYYQKITYQCISQKFTEDEQKEE